MHTVAFLEISFPVKSCICGDLASTACYAFPQIPAHTVAYPEIFLCALVHINPPGYCILLHIQQSPSVIAVYLEIPPLHVYCANPQMPRFAYSCICGDSPPFLHTVACLHCCLSGGTCTCKYLSILRFLPSAYFSIFKGPSICIFLHIKRSLPVPRRLFIPALQ